MRPAAALIVASDPSARTERSANERRPSAWKRASSVVTAVVDAMARWHDTSPGAIADQQVDHASAGPRRAA